MRNAQQHSVHKPWNWPWWQQAGVLVHQEAAVCLQWPLQKHLLPVTCTCGKHSSQCTKVDIVWHYYLLQQFNGKVHIYVHSWHALWLLTYPMWSCHVKTSLDVPGHFHCKYSPLEICQGRIAQYSTSTDYAARLPSTSLVYAYSYTIYILRRLQGHQLLH